MVGGKETVCPNSSKKRAQAHKPDDIALKTPPYNLEAEQSVLGAILLDDGAAQGVGALDMALASLAPDDFYREAHRLIFRVMARLADMNCPIDAVTLTSTLQAEGALEQIGGPAYVAELAAVVPTARNVATYIKIVRDRSTLREIAATAADIARASYECPANVAEFVASAERRVQAIVARDESVSDVATEPEGCRILGERGTLPRAEYVVNRLVPEGMPTTMFAGAATGKSMMALYLAICVAEGRDFLGLKTKQGPVLYLDAETNGDAVDWRFGRILAGLNASPPPSGVLYVKIHDTLTNPREIARIGKTRRIEKRHAGSDYR